MTGDLDPRETVLYWSVSRDAKDGLGKDSAIPHSSPSLQASTSGQSQSKPQTEPQARRPSVSLSTRILPSNISLRHIRTISTTRNAHAHIPPTPSPAFTAALAAFFTFLDSQLSKIESFYLDREKEMMARTAVLEGQLRELAEHGEVFNVSTRCEYLFRPHIQQPSNFRLSMHLTFPYGRGPGRLPFRLNRR